MTCTSPAERSAGQTQHLHSRVGCTETSALWLQISIRKLALIPAPSPQLGRLNLLLPSVYWEEHTFTRKTTPDTWEEQQLRGHQRLQGCTTWPGSGAGRGLGAPREQEQPPKLGLDSALTQTDTQAHTHTHTRRKQGAQAAVRGAGQGLPGKRIRSQERAPRGEESRAGAGQRGRGRQGTGEGPGRARGLPWCWVRPGGSQSET